MRFLCGLFIGYGYRIYFWIQYTQYNTIYISWINKFLFCEAIDVDLTYGRRLSLYFPPVFLTRVLPYTPGCVHLFIINTFLFHSIARSQENTNFIASIVMRPASDLAKIFQAPYIDRFKIVCSDIPSVSRWYSEDGSKNKIYMYMLVLQLWTFLM